WEAEAPKLNITTVEINWDDATGIDIYADLPIHTAYHLYSSVGEYKINITAFAYGALISKTVTVLIEDEVPEGEILVQLANGTFVDPTLQEITIIETEFKQVTFFVNGSDLGGSDIAKIVIETDEGNLFEFLNATEATVPFLTFGEHDIIFRVYDRSGNFFEVEFKLKLVAPPEPTMGPVPYPFGVISMLGLVALAVIYLRKKR
ncbi:MAG: hypothetical protein H7641_00005, partial [Candidatus Heimdallarchaeota archaeon]|nr:hypothetical protein [Candidatus Heimdallarchaeota archaeon]MCK4875945.1 hypothetical protein [Candidatus Heimdallarchaeota archaeon]